MLTTQSLCYDWNRPADQDRASFKSWCDIAPRNLDNAYFENEQGSQVAGSNLFLNKFKARGAPWNFHVDLKNYLDPAVRAQRQPQAIPSASQGQKSRYDLYIGSKTLQKIQNAKAAGTRLPELKISLLFGVGQDLDNLGLRYYFEQIDDRVLINVPGNEGVRWNFGITGLIDAARGIAEDQIKDLMTGAGLGNVPYKITIVAAYSTGYGGLNQSVNEGLFPLQDIETAVYYDCTYRADKPAPAKNDPPVTLTPAETNSGPDEFDSGHSGSAYNTQRARKRIADATGQKAAFVGYMATPGGSPLYKHPSTAQQNQYTVDFSTKIDLRAPAPGYPVTYAESLFALVLTRSLAYARVDGQVTAPEVPASFRDLETVLPQRGKVASTTATLKAKPGFSPTTALLDWGRTNAAKVKKAQLDVAPAIKLISDRKLMYPSGYPGPGNEAGALHAGLLPEFAWEHLL